MLPPFPPLKGQVVITEVLQRGVDNQVPADHGGSVDVGTAANVGAAAVAGPSRGTEEARRQSPEEHNLAADGFTIIETPERAKQGVWLVCAGVLLRRGDGGVCRCVVEER